MYTYDTYTYLSKNLRMCQVGTHKNVWNTAQTLWKEAHTSQNWCMRWINTMHAWQLWCIRITYTHLYSKTCVCVRSEHTDTLETQHKCQPNKHIRHKMNACAKKYDACVGIVMDTFEKLTYVSENQRMCQVRTHNNVWNTAQTFWKEAHTSQNGCMRRNITVLAWKMWCIRLKYTHICPKTCVYVR